MSLRHEVILADPPWAESGSGKSKRGADRHYQLMKTAAIADLAPAVDGLAMPESFLFLWATANHLPDALHVMKAWGYKYITNFAWVKDKIGLGFYARGQHELCLLGRRGWPARARRVPGNWGTKTPSVIMAPRRRHSEKPDAIFEIAESFGKPRLELFARRQRPGWTCIGDELGTRLQGAAIERSLVAGDQHPESNGGEDEGSPRASQQVGLWQPSRQ